MNVLKRIRACPVLLLAGAGAALADEPAQLESVVVIGTRASLDSAQQRKREHLDIVDSVVAAEINKLPDLNVSDALQRVTGIQIVRDRGEGSIVSLRGLTQVETTLNGREVFTAGGGRTLDFADFASEMLSGIDVYKSASAERIEGGMAGTIDLRTRRPFDFSGDANVVSARLIHGDLVGRDAGQFSALASRRWALGGGAGDFGVLLNLVVQERTWREDLKSTGNPMLCSARTPLTTPSQCRFDLIPGQDVVAPNGTSETTSEGRRRRTGATLITQWRPNDALELYAEGHFAELRTIQDSHQINATRGPSFVPGSVTLFPGTSDLSSITWTSAPLSVLSFARDTVDRSRQLAAGGRWTNGVLSLSGDLSHTKSYNNLFFSGPFFGATAAQFSQDVSGDVPQTSVTGTDLLNPANLRYTGLAYRTRPFAGDLTATRLDAEWQRPGAFFERLAVGWRFAKRSADNTPGLIFADAAVTGLTAADTPGRVRPNPYDNFLDGAASSIGPYLVGDLGDARNAAGLRNAFGITTPIPAAANPLSVWRIQEQTHAVYLKGDFQVADGRLDGNAGVRAVHTRTSVTGTQSVPSSGTTAPIDLDAGTTDWLPQLNVRYHLEPGLLLRAAASRTITRPNFDQLSPSLTLVPNPTNPSLNQGGAGNPALQAVRADNIDLAIEHYGGPAQSASLTLFWKKVDGFISSAAQDEVHDGATYSVSRPYNRGSGNVRGLEAAYQRFFDFLPGAWRGLGIQANYTYVDGHAPDPVLGADAPLQNLSRHSGNLIGLYEHGPVVARLAYNWRSKFLSGATSVVGVGALGIYTRSYGWLDASLGYRIDKRMTVSLEAGNILGTIRRSYYGTPTRPQGAWANDRQLAVSMSVQF